jgi:hypothetical protein
VQADEPSAPCGSFASGILFDKHQFDTACYCMPPSPAPGPVCLLAALLAALLELWPRPNTHQYHYATIFRQKTRLMRLTTASPTAQPTGTAQADMT